MRYFSTWRGGVDRDYSDLWRVGVEGEEERVLPAPDLHSDRSCYCCGCCCSCTGVGSCHCWGQAHYPATAAAPWCGSWSHCPCCSIYSLSLPRCAQDHVCHGRFPVGEAGVEGAGTISITPEIHYSVRSCAAWLL